jgi:Uma2 family endonuclease
MKTAKAKPRTSTVVANGKPVRGGMSLFGNDLEIHVPGWVVDIDSFRRWTKAPDFPLRGNIWWLRGEVWADMSNEQVFWHGDVKGAIYAVLYFVVKNARLGRILPDGILLTNHEADISGNPDGMFLSRKTLDSNRVRVKKGAKDGMVEVQGIPDMVLEVVSDSSVKKDLVTLYQAYWEAGISEYWLADARRDQLRFDIFRSTPKGYKASPKKNGWLRSDVFGKSFRLIVAFDKSGYPEYTLEVR